MTRKQTKMEIVDFILLDSIISTIPHMFDGKSIISIIEIIFIQTENMLRQR